VGESAARLVKRLGETFGGQPAAGMGNQAQGIPASR